MDRHGSGMSKNGLSPQARSFRHVLGTYKWAGISTAAASSFSPQSPIQADLSLPMDNIRFYHCPPTSKKREHPASTGSTSTSGPVFEVSGSSETRSDHVQDDQTASQGRSQKPTASFVAAIDLSVQEEIGLRFRSSSDHVATDMDDRSVNTDFGPRKG